MELPIGIMNENLEAYDFECAGICSKCYEHCDFNSYGSYCCAANPLSSDPDVDMER